MGKKKAKKNHPLTQDEIWDDSALIRSWDEAVEEYNLYHSIHARGEDVEEVLRAADSDDLAEERLVQSGPPNGHEDSSMLSQKATIAEDMELEDGEINDHDIDQDLDVDPAAPPKSTPTKTKQQPTLSGPPNAGSGGADLSAAAVPHEVLAGHTDSLKNLMMAWYWAGYYTRQAEEQQQRKA